MKAFLIFAASSLYTLFSTLDPQSVSQSLAFYELYPTTEEGQLALKRAQNLLQTQVDIKELAAAFNAAPSFSETLSESELQLIEKLAEKLPNRQLKGYYAKNEEEIKNLTDEQIDIGQALVLSQSIAEGTAKARQYSARLDMMALQILATLPKKADAHAKIAAINHFLFEHLHIKFPPHSVFAKEIDKYTFLASVMDDHLGVCLGVTTVYLALAQRLDLPLEIITPPGHIYLRYREGKKVVNIETTARGVDMPSEVYLGVNTCRLQQRRLKEVVGMTHVNQASVFLHTGDYEKAKVAYEKAMPYMPDDHLLQELLAYSYLFTGQEQKAVALLKKVQESVPDYAICQKALARDYLEGRIHVEGIKAVLTLVDETRESLLKKKACLEKILDQCPYFADGYFQLGITWVQLGRNKEALHAFSRYKDLHPEDPQGPYYLAILHAERKDFKQSWDNLVEAEKIVAKRFFLPRALKELREELCLNCPP